MPIAVDVAILLSGDARTVVERLNAGFDHAPDAGFRFGPSCHPHVTLSQHFVQRERLSEVRRLVGDVVRRLDPFEARVAGARAGRTLRDEEVAGDADAFHADGEPARPADVAWVEGFRERSSYAHYDPHVTVGIGARPLSAAPFRFPVEEIALCRLGRFCTCRDRLASWAL